MNKWICRDEDEHLDIVIKNVFRALAYGPCYDVFINHRGPDVKETFTNDLYNCLCSCGFRVFLDKKELMSGLRIASQIEVTIQYTHFYVAIFSLNYAQSSWCLNQLKLKVRSGNTILPLFYKVRCSDLQCPKDGVYVESLIDHKNEHR
jgi:hypothetical protein